MLTVLSSFAEGKKIIVTLLDGTDIKGTTLNGLEDGARVLGFDTKAIRVDNDTFKSKYTLRAIARYLDSGDYCPNNGYLNI